MERERQRRLGQHLLNRQKTFYLTNSGRDLIKVPWGGEMIVIPGSHGVMAPHARYDDVRHSVILELPKVVTIDGVETTKLVPTLIPGTLVLKDIIYTGELEERLLVWDAANFIMEKIGQNFDGDYGLRGLSWAPADATLEELRALMNEGKSRWEESRIKDAQMIEYEQRTKEGRWVQHGLQPPPPPQYYQEALEILRIAAERRQKLVTEMFHASDPYARIVHEVTGTQDELGEGQLVGGMAVSLSLIEGDKQEKPGKPGARKPS